MDKNGVADSKPTCEDTRKGDRFFSKGTECQLRSWSKSAVL